MSEQDDRKWRQTTLGPFRGDYANKTQEWATADYVNDLESRLAAADRDEGWRLAEQLGAAAREWLRAKDYRDNLPVPFGATPRSHPEVFGNALASAKEGNRLLTEALADYEAAKARRER
jgi:hypothetical protein